MKAIIISGGNIVNHDIIKNLIKSDDFIICADKGMNYAKELNIMPNLIVGDFDSCDINVLDEFKNVKTYKFNPEKDFTDTDIAVSKAVELGFKNIILFCATGSRLDHTFANIMLLEKYMNLGIKLEIYDNSNHIMIHDSNSVLKIKRQENHYLSMLPLSDMLRGLTIKGVKYPLENACVKRGESLLISNEVLDENAEIFMDEGIALVFISKDL